MSDRDTGHFERDEWGTLLGQDGGLFLATEDTYLDAFQRKVSSSEYRHVLSFDLAGQRYALGLTDITEIRRYVPPTPIPGTKDFVLGIIALRGTVVPVLDLRIRLGLPASPPTSRSRYLLLAGEEQLGLLVDAILDVVALPRDNLEDPPVTIGQHQAEFIEGIGRSGQQLVILLKPAPIVAFDPLLVRDTKK